MFKLNNDTVFQYIYFITKIYKPDDVNKKKIKQLFECIPFFITTNREQTILYELIKNHSIINYYDTKENLFKYGYIIYKYFHKENNLPYLEEESYIRHYDTLLFINKDEIIKKRKRILSRLGGIIIIFFFLYFIYVY